MSRNQVVTAFFRSKEDADRAVDGLIEAGFDRGQIDIVAGGSESDASERSYEQMGFWQSLKELFIPDEDRHVYAEGLRRGGYMVAVHTAADNYDQALEILDRDGTVDLGSEESGWRSEGWKGYQGPDTSASHRVGRTFDSTQGTDTAPLAADYEGEQVIPIAEEELRVGKRDVSHGRVRVRSYVVERPVEEEVKLRDERVVVEHRPVDRPLAADEQAFSERTIEAEEKSEEPVVSKVARVKEELVVKKKTEDRTEKVSGTVRETKVDLDDPRQPGTPRSR